MNYWLKPCFAMFIAELRADDLDWLRDRLESGQLRSVIDRRFTLEEVPAAMDYMEQGRTRGKNIIVVAEPR
jgi:NADPH:quinone reductase-like Zn-dependent oxidoreductase